MNYHLFFLIFNEYSAIQKSVNILNNCAVAVSDINERDGFLVKDYEVVRGDPHLGGFSIARIASVG